MAKALSFPDLEKETISTYVDLRSTSRMILVIDKDIISAIADMNHINS